MANFSSLRLLKTMLVLALPMVLLVGCESKQPEGPEVGSVQRYLDENPDVAARAEEGDGGGKEEEDGVTYDDE